MNKKIALIGLGYVGLPLAVEFGKKFVVVGFDINQSRINDLSNGIDSNLEITSAELEDATRKNIKSLGLPFDDDRDVLLMRDENGWGSDKVSRRALVAKDYRILMLVGDQLTDFISLVEAATDIDSRRKLAEKYSDMWGKKWFMLTNPMYGKWEGAIYGNKYPDTKEEMMKMRLDALKP